VSTIFELDEPGWQKLVADSNVSQEDFDDAMKPGFFEGSLTGPFKGIMQGGVDTFDLLATIESTQNIELNAERVRGEHELQDAYQASQEELRKSASDFWTPKVHELGTAGRVLNGLGRLAIPVALGGGTPIVAVPATTLATGKALIDQGVDAQTAGASAGLQGLATYAGFEVPFLGKSLASKVATGGALNVLIGGGTEAAQRELLERNGYDELAQGYHPLDVESRAIDFLMGAGFGGLAHLHDSGMTPTEQAAAFTAGNAKHYQQDTAPGIPLDYETQAAHTQAMDIAFGQMMRGEPVSIPPELLAKMSFKARPERAPVDEDVWREVFGEDMPKAPPETAAEPFTAKAEPAGEEGIRNPLTFDATPEQKLTELKALTKENLPVVQKLVEDLNARLAKTESKLNVKEDVKILEKAQRPEILSKKPWHDVEHGLESQRVADVLDSLDQLPKVVDALRDAGIEAVKVDTGKLLTPGPWGWRIASLDLRMPNGQLVEHYMPLKEMEAAKKNGGHQLFEKWRNKDLFKLTPEERTQYEADRQKSRDLYQAAWDAAVARTGLDDKAAEASLTSFATSAESLISKHSSKSAPVNGTSVRQTPLSRSAETASERTATSSGDSLNLKADAVMVDSSGAIVPDDGFVAPVISAVKELLAQEDRQVATGAVDAEGNAITRSGREVMAEHDAAIKEAELQAKGIEAAVSCVLTRGTDA
jgi:hypothetical protein